jgi:ribonuclease P protein component
VLAVDHRLRERDAFRRTVRSGRRAGSSALVLHLSAPDRDAEAAGLPSPRVGFVVGKPVGNAVVRNRVRRRLCHLVAPLVATLPAGSELVVRALPAAAGLGSAELGRELERCLERARRTDSPVSARTGATS